MSKTAEEEFHTSSQHDPPPGWSGPLFEICNNYPSPAQFASGFPALPLPDIPGVEAKWLEIDFRNDPEDYAKLILEYCWEGNKSVDFVVQKNTVRDWYHAPWMHAGPNGREPLKGLTFERPIPAKELAAKQTSAHQNWAIGFYNAPGASVFGGVWANPSKPVWNEDLKFPQGSCTFKVLMTTAKEDEVFTLKGAPAWPAVISPNPPHEPKKAPSSGHYRNNFKSEVRLIQVDFAVVDHRSPIGWVFGTFMYDGTLENITDPWKRLTCVGVQWGNDPTMDQAAIDADRNLKPKETWINRKAEDLRKALGGERPSWGYNGRLCGPADNFVSSCASCHSTAQSITTPMVQPGNLVKVKSEKRVHKKWVPLNERLTMTWFENVKAGEPFSNRGALSADYSLQFTTGWTNYLNWRKLQHNVRPGERVLAALPGPVGRRVVFRLSDTANGISEEVEEVLRSVVYEDPPARAGPDLDWTYED